MFLHSTLHVNRMGADRLPGRRVVVAIVIVLAAGWFLASPVAAQDIIRNYTPAVWQGDSVRWARDINPQNKIDDLIDASPDDFFDVVLNFKRCVEDGDVVQLEAMTAFGHVTKRLRYITSVAMNTVAKHELDSIAQLYDVAFIEGQWGFATTLDVSVENVRMRAGFYSPNTVEDVNPGLDGSGVNIVIMDTGVDDVVHDAFNATPFIAGYDAITQTFVNPDDDAGHGTHVASIALGQATANTARGMAPGAGLIDVRVMDASTTCSTPGAWARFVDGLETTYDNRDIWGVDVINMSFGECNASGYVMSDGLDAFSQLVDLAEAMGIVVVAAVGNSGPTNNGMTAPAAATRAITVAGSNDNNNPDRTATTIYNSSSRGPRDDDFDSDFLDELKPEVTAPGQDILAARFNTTNLSLSATGTSMAAPHVAGLAAVIIQARPTITAGSVKDLIISTAEAFGTPSLPGTDPIWNDRWGWGLIDAHAAITAAASTDLTFPNYPSSPIWLSPDIITVPFPPKVGVANTITAMIDNKGPNPAISARIQFGVHEFSAAIPGFTAIGTQIVNLPLGVTPVSMTWTPNYTGHQCLFVEIAYSPDTDYGNNKAQRNVDVAASPVWFQVRNTYSDAPALIMMKTTFEYPDSNWEVIVTPDTLTLAGDDCPRDVEVLLMPLPGAQPGDTQMVHVEAVIPTFVGEISLGGVSVIETVDGCPVVITGDVNVNGSITSADIIYLVTYVFKGGAPPLPCTASGDVNCNGSVTSADIIHLVNFVFKGGTPPCDVCTMIPSQWPCP